MKKILITLIAILFVSIIPVSASTSDITPGSSVITVNGVATSKFQAGGYSCIETSFKNNGNTDKKVTMVLMEYSTSGGFKKMIGTGTETKLIPAGKTVEFSPGFSMTSDTSGIKYFAYLTDTLEPVATESFAVDRFQFLGTEDNNTSVYKINRFVNIDDSAIDKIPVTGLTTPSVCTWSDNKAAAVSITMDDGIYDAALSYLNLFQLYNIHGTQMVKGNNIAPGGVVDKAAVKKWQDIFDTGFMDCGNHSYDHAIKYNTDTYTDEQLKHDITDSYNVLSSNFPTQDIITFATPWGQNAERALNEIRKNHYTNRSAGGGVIQTRTPSNWYTCASYAVQYGTPLSTLNGFVDTAISSNGWYIELLHGVGTTGTDSNSYSTNMDTCAEHFRYIGQTKADKVWAGSYTEVTKYIYERDTAKPKILWATNSSMGVKVTDSMDDEIFNYPLTLKVNLPTGWTGTVYCSQNGKTTQFTAFTENGKTYAYVKVIPDCGYAVLKK